MPDNLLDEDLLKEWAKVEIAKITKIIKVVNDIVFQTNLLALDADVEIACTGKYSKGFPAPAEEVRNLAARLAKVAKETAEIIEALVNRAEIGGRVADTKEMLTDIIADSAKIANYLSEVSPAKIRLILNDTEFIKY